MDHRQEAQQVELELNMPIVRYLHFRKTEQKNNECGSHGRRTLVE